MTQIDFKGKIILVTGSNRPKGIGRSFIHEAIKRGTKKIYAACRNTDHVKDLVEQYPQIIHPITLDVTNKQQIQDAAQNCNDTQILVNNAGVSKFCGICEKYNEDDARAEIEVNYFGPLHLTQAFTPNLKKNQNCAIVNIVSIAALSPTALAATYSASKAALHAVTRTSRKELCTHNISVFGVYPGPLETSMTEGFEFPMPSSQSAATYILDAMEKGQLDMTTDEFGHAFKNYLKLDPEAEAMIDKYFR
ncbi:MAG: SDR family NAD(P)-dependent oxidoreductase [Chlamydiae bacterium]|nr:hypothetical protein [Chlamydiales bacterium]MCH9704432.1 SDR family NAD(P)-dependent oxidoreductase [Chlamydiota bacterium]